MTHYHYSNYITPGCDIILQHIFLQSGFAWVVQEGTESVVPAVESFGRGGTVLLVWLTTLYKAYTFVSLSTGGCMEGWSILTSVHC